MPETAPFPVGVGAELRNSQEAQKSKAEYRCCSVAEFTGAQSLQHCDMCCRALLVAVCLNKQILHIIYYSLWGLNVPNSQRAIQQ